ncbi:MAG: type VI secretion system contractile sheath small subunit [Gammaproteobacteria bacterium]|jgi:type VI secretion system protein ImpB|nr:type VI secretion system contractile sheath small subunit [Acidiferrobacteraceae bacterium]MBT4987325.1 type VI secretion system contractile sheath small subunit [Pseudomonadota bacterium]MBT5624198.1 type VI secretion system contractile sheath small subunit [Pseudomonadota bacterium]MBT6067017.1 type VI secretion system contractile sheath small subunit [Pseudomonadota bacterium]MBT6665286.1 type VI secretion system contractile sheath small subunit [Gammaproteobacteria bacterium]
MAKSLDSAVAPKERINIVYQPATGGRKEEIELPLKLMVLGDFSGAKETPFSDREPTEISSPTVSGVMAAMDVSAEYSVPNTLTGDGEIAVKLEFTSTKDLSPAAVIDQVPELKQMLGLRDALKALRAPIGNSSEFRKLIDEKVSQQK